MEFRDSKKEVKKLLASERKTAALVAPSIASEFEDITDYRKFASMLKALGFEYVHEDSFGVDLIASQYANLFEEAEGKIYHNNCPVIVKLIRSITRACYNLAPLYHP